MPAEQQSSRTTREAEAVFRVQGVTKVYTMGTNKVHALRGIDFTVDTKKAVKRGFLAKLNREPEVAFRIRV